MLGAQLRLQVHPHALQDRDGALVISAGPDKRHLGESLALSKCVAPFSERSTTRNDDS